MSICHSNLDLLANKSNLALFISLSLRLQVVSYLYLWATRLYIDDHLSYLTLYCRERFTIA